MEASNKAPRLKLGLSSVWAGSMKRVGRPPLAYDVKHVTINMKVEHYKRMRRDGENMSRIINNYLDDHYAYSICPSCYGDDFIAVSYTHLTLPTNREV